MKLKILKKGLSHINQHKMYNKNLLQHLKPKPNETTPVSTEPMISFDSNN
jgi:hypothetical protein